MLGGVIMKLRSAVRSVGLATAVLSFGAMAVGLTSTVAFASTQNVVSVKAPQQLRHGRSIIKK